MGSRASDWYKPVLLAAVIAFGLFSVKTVPAQEHQNTGYRLSVIGIGVKDYQASQDFYGKKMGLREAFKFTTPDGRATTYYQLSRDTFLEMQQAGGDIHPGLTHVHLVVDNLKGMIARLKQAGIPGAARNATTPGTVTEEGEGQATKVKNANIYDPAGLRLELNELSPESLTTKATESWSDTYPSYRLYVAGINYNDAMKDFYEEKLGFKEVFTINAANHPYLQMSRASFVDFIHVRENAAPVFSHVHVQVDDLTKTVARLKEGGISVREAPYFSPPTQLYSTHIVDPDGAEIEINQWADSLPKKAAESWK
jgi:catechol 2,3-dioxygenase-like lactoylglutathione lyase family enzyme